MGVWCIHIKGSLVVSICVGGTPQRGVDCHIRAGPCGSAPEGLGSVLEERYDQISDRQWGGGRHPLILRPPWCYTVTPGEVFILHRSMLRWRTCSPESHQHSCWRSLPFTFDEIFPQAAVKILQSLIHFLSDKTLAWTSPVWKIGSRILFEKSQYRNQAVVCLCPTPLLRVLLGCQPPSLPSDRGVCLLCSTLDKTCPTIPFPRTYPGWETWRSQMMQTSMTKMTCLPPNWYCERLQDLPLHDHVVSQSRGALCILWGGSRMGGFPFPHNVGVLYGVFWFLERGKAFSNWQLLHT